MAEKSQRAAARNSSRREVASGEEIKRNGYKEERFVKAAQLRKFQTLKRDGRTRAEEEREREKERER